MDGVWWDYCDVCYQLFGTPFWRHPFTAEHPLLSKWWNATFLKIWWRNKLIYILDELRMSTFSAKFHFGWTIPLSVSHLFTWVYDTWTRTCTVTCNPNCEDKVPGLAKSLARRPGAIVFSSRATKIYHCPARRAILSTGLPRNVPSKLRAHGRTLLQPRPRRRNNVPLAQKLVGKAIWLNASKSKRIAMLRQTAIELLPL